MLRVAEGSCTRCPSSAALSFTWQPRRDLPGACSVLRNTRGNEEAGGGWGERARTRRKWESSGKRGLRGHARGRQPKREVQQVLLLLARRGQRVKRGGLEDHVARGARKGALAGALQLHAIRVRKVHQVLPRKAPARNLHALFHKRDRHRRRAREDAAVAVRAHKGVASHSGATREGAGSAEAGKEGHFAA